MSDYTSHKSMWLEDNINKTITEQVKIRELDRLKTKEGIEERLYVRLRQIWQDVKLYAPESKYLSMCILETEDGTLSFNANNKYYSDDRDMPINVTVYTEVKHGTDVSR